MHSIDYIKKLILSEEDRQNHTISLIASENCCSDDIRSANGSRLTDKYAEGYPGQRYYNGTKIIDEIEKCAIDAACMLFKCKWANVQPHSGSQANQAVFAALLKPGDTILSLNLQDGGHLTHGSKVNISGQLYNVEHYSLDSNELIDMDAVETMAIKVRPRLIIAGSSAYSRIIDWRRFRTIADKTDAYLLCDIAHYAGLIAGDSYPNPLEYAHVATSTTHKVLRGPRGGLIISNNPILGKKIDRAVFPGIQGGPMIHTIAGKAICFYEAMSNEFKTYTKHVVTNAKRMADRLSKLGWRVVSNGTDCHLFNIDLRSKSNLSGKEASDLLEQYGIMVNMECIPNDERSPKQGGSGIRIGTASITTRGMHADEAKKLADIIDAILGRKDDLEEISATISDICLKFPLEKA